MAGFSDAKQYADARIPTLEGTVPPEKRTGKSSPFCKPQAQKKTRPILSRTGHSKRWGSKPIAFYASPERQGPRGRKWPERC